MGATCLEVASPPGEPQCCSMKVAGSRYGGGGSHKPPHTDSSLRWAPKGLKVSALQQDLHRRTAADRCGAARGSEISLASVTAAARLAEGLWYSGDFAAAASAYADAQHMCERLAGLKPGPKTELRLAELLVSRALAELKVASASATAAGGASAHVAAGVEAPLDLLHKARDLAHRHEVVKCSTDAAVKGFDDDEDEELAVDAIGGRGRPLDEVSHAKRQAARAAMIAAVAAHGLGSLWQTRGDVARARGYLEEALARLGEARLGGQTPRPVGAAGRAPRYAYLEEVQRSLLRCGPGPFGAAPSAGSGAEAGSAGLAAPVWWRYSGLAEILSAQGQADAALAHRLCAAALMDDEASAEPAVGAMPEVRCGAWLDIADNFAEVGDSDTAQIYRDRAYRYAQSIGLPLSSAVRRRAWAAVQPLR